MSHKLSRRQAISSLLGASLASLWTEGCSTDVPVGEMVGANASLGHVLRDMGSPETLGEVVEHRSVPVLIVGGGVAGLSAAWRLQGDGRVDYHLLELESRLGGTAVHGERDGWKYPWGAHYVPLPVRRNPTLERLLYELGAVDLEASRQTGRVVGTEQALVAEAEERVFFKGKWRDGLVPHAVVTSKDRGQLTRLRKELLRWARWSDDWGRPAFAIPIATCSTDPFVTELDRISAAQWLDRLGIDSPVVRWYVDYACRDDYGSTLETTSAWAAVFYFAARMDPTTGQEAPFVTWPEGNGRVVDFLARSVQGRRHHTSQLVVDVSPRTDHVAVLVLDGVSRRLRLWKARHVILAVPRYVTARMYRPWRLERPGWLQSFQTAPWFVANVHLREYPSSFGVAPAWDNVIYDSPSLGYVRSEHQVRARTVRGVWTYYYAMTDPDPDLARRKLLETGRYDWADVVLTDLSVAHPDIRDKVERIDVMRWGHAMVRPRPGFVWSQGRLDAWKPREGRVHFAHTDLSGVALVEEALYHGVRAAEEVLEALEGLPWSWL